MNPSKKRQSFVVKKFDSFEESESADLAYYRSLTGEQRLEILLDLVKLHMEATGETDKRLERVHRIVELSQS